MSYDYEIANQRINSMIEDANAFRLARQARETKPVRRGLKARLFRSSRAHGSHRRLERLI
ncbi:hypothetical protein [Stackebrandtia nassauensis]|uniref:Uncharacterized protein n=1 Tax=Stackebrandtia nassauensis (strain DSM 44728 / CIP 108903 / NRRL B-16338 / NBRC 102104 / LLR-40K-21) TaxID=446470 RepID=D3PY87_STANL|nr:hypothetical protein [Stackebrandtia nassauensis]ADD41454.1 hypothetical protein Snas_1756 [Stackebrandtia nassauensis DSM 44728]